MVVDHVGIVVKSLEDGLKTWTEAFGYQVATHPVINTRQKVRVVFLEKADSVMVKLVEPTDESSPVFALARRGGGLHHLCFRDPDLAGALKTLEMAGGRTLVGPQPGEAFENEPIGFSYLKGLAIEVIATTKKAARL
jgi:methylmalonyl-CoA/ethylmalonyl-CoA epimerase